MTMISAQLHGGPRIIFMRLVLCRWHQLHGGRGFKPVTVTPATWRNRQYTSAISPMPPYAWMTIDYTCYCDTSSSEDQALHRWCFVNLSICSGKRLVCVQHRHQGTVIYFTELTVFLFVHCHNVITDSAKVELWLHKPPNASQAILPPPPPKKLTFDLLTKKGRCWYRIPVLINNNHRGQGPNNFRLEPTVDVTTSVIVN